MMYGSPSLSPKLAIRMHFDRENCVITCAFAFKNGLVQDDTVIHNLFCGTLENAQRAFECASRCSGTMKTVKAMPLQRSEEL